MDYESLLNSALEELPEFKKQYEKEIKEDSIDANSGMHTVFSIVFVPLLLKAMQSDVELANRMFEFIEKMETSGSALVGEVSEFTIMEELCDELSDDELLPFLRPETFESWKEVRRYIRKGQNEY